MANPESVGGCDGPPGMVLLRRLQERVLLRRLLERVLLRQVQERMLLRA